MIDEDITRGFIAENGIDVYMIDVTPAKVSLTGTYPKNITFYVMTRPGTFKPEKIIENLDSVFLFVTTYSGSNYVLSLISGTLEVGTIGGLDDNKRIYFKTEQIDNIKILKLFVPI